MAKEDFTTLRLHKTNINQVKVAIPGTPYTLGSFYEQAALEKLEREKKIPENAKITFGGVDISDRYDPATGAVTILDFLAEENKPKI